MPYPFILGGTSGDTEITAIDVDGNYNILFGGWTQDSSFNGASSINQLPIIGFVTFGGKVTVLKTISSSTYSFEEVAAVQVGYDSNYFFVLDQSPLTMGWLEGYSGYSLHAYSIVGSTSDYSMMQNGMVPENWDGAFYMNFAMVSDTQNWQIIRFNMSQGTNSFKAYTSNSPGGAYSIILGNTFNYYVGGFQTSQNTSKLYATVSRINYNGTLQWTQGLDMGISPSSYFYFNVLYVSGTSLYGCAQSTSTAQGDLLFFKGYLNGSYDFYSPKVLQFTNGQMNQCLQLVSSTSVNVLINIKSTSQMVLASISSFSTTPSISFQLLDSVAGTSSQMTSAAFVNGYSGQAQYVYYAGKANTVQYITPGQAYTYQQGFIMTWSDIQSCLTFTYASVTTYGSVASYVTSLFGLVNETVSNATGVGFTSTSIISASSNITYTDTARAWCQSKYPVTLTMPTISTQYCYSNISDDFPYATFNDTNCADSNKVSYSVTYPNRTSLPFYMSFYTPHFYCTNSYLYQEGTEVLSYNADSNNWNNYSTTVDVEFGDQCSASTYLIESSLVNQTYVIGAPSLSYDVPVFSIGSMTDSNYCFISSGSFVISSIVPSSGSNPITMSGGQYLKVHQTNNSYIGNYTVTITEYLNIQNYSFSASFNVELKDMCYDTMVEYVSIADQSYDINEFTNVTLDSATWTQNISYCQSTYPLTYQMFVSPNTSIFYMSASKKITVFTEALADLGTYTITIVGNASYFAQNQTSFQATITNKCPTASITTKSVNYSSGYIIGNSNMTLYYSSWTTPYSYCQSASYSAEYTNGTSLDDFITFNNVSRTFQIHTNDTNDAGSYPITITGIFPNGSSSTYSFTLVIIDPCPTATLHSPFTQTFLYLLQSDLQELVPSNFTSSEGANICGAWNYQYDFIDFNMSYASYSPTTLGFYINSSDYLLAGNYIVNIVAWQGTYSTHNATQNFTLEVIDTCRSVKIYPSTVVASIYNTSDIAYTFSIPQFTDSLSGICGAYNYSLTASSGLAFDSSIFTVSYSNMTLTIYSDIPSQQGLYNFTLTGTLPHNYGNASTNFTIEIDCLVRNLSTLPQNGSYNYEVGSSTLTVDFVDLIKWPNCPQYTFTYTLNINNNQQYSSPFITVQSPDKTIQVQTSSIYNIGVYTVGLNGTLNDTTSTTAILVYYEIYIYGDPPQFVSTLSNITMTAGTVMKYSLPGTQASLGLTANITYYDGEVTFMKYYQNIFTLQPGVDDVGVHTISIVLTDKTFIFLSTSYTLQITVQPKPVPIPVNTTDSSSSSVSINDTFYSGGGFNQTKNTGPGNQLVNLSSSVGSQDISEHSQELLRATISVVNMQGIMKIKFGSEIVIPTQFTMINDTEVFLKVIPSDESNITTLNFTWNVTDFSSQYMTIQLLFEDPLEVSKYASDAISVTFIKNKMFMTSPNITYLPKNYTIGYYLPRLMKNDRSNFLYLMVVAGVYLIYFILRLLQNQGTWLKKMFTYAQKTLIYSFLLRFLIENYMNFSICTILNLFVVRPLFITYPFIACLQLKFGTYSDIIGSAFTIIFSVYLLVLPYFIPIFLLVNFQKLSDSTFSSRYNSLYENLNIKSKMALMFNFVFLFRRFLFCMTVFYMDASPVFQIQSLIIQSLLYLLYIGYIAPYETKFNNYLDMFNEGCTIGILYHLFIYTDFVPNDELQYGSGWSLIVVTVLVLLVNSFIVIVISGKSLIAALKRSWFRCKLKKMRQRKYILEQSGVTQVKFLEDTLKYQLGNRTAIEEDEGLSQLNLNKDVTNKNVLNRKAGGGQKEEQKGENDILRIAKRRDFVENKQQANKFRQHLSKKSLSTLDSQFGVPYQFNKLQKAELNPFKRLDQMAQEVEDQSKY